MLLIRHRHREIHLTWHWRPNFGFATFQHNGLWSVLQVGCLAITYGR